MLHETLAEMLKMNNPSRFYLMFLTLSVTFGGVVFGYHMAVISGAIASLKEFFIDPFGWPEGIANSRLGLVVSSALFGCIAGASSGGLISRYLGRKTGLLIAALLLLLSATGSAMPELFFRPIGEADHTFVTAFVVYRIIGGFGVGLGMLVPLYIAEIAPAGIRGKLVSLTHFAIILGVLVAYFVNYSIARQGEDAWLHQVGWRWMFASETIPALLFAILLLMVPETPRYYVMKGSESKALKVLSRINGTEEARAILLDIKATFADTGSPSKKNRGKLFTGKLNGLFAFGPKVIVIGVLIPVIVHLSGINVILYYAPVIFSDMGTKTDASLLSTIFVGAVTLLFAIPAVFTVDRFGRKPLLKIGAIVMAVAMGLLGFTFFLGMNETVIGGEVISQFTSRFAAVSALTLILIFVAGFSMSWGPVGGVVTSEIFPNRIRGRALALAATFSSIANLVVTWTFPVLNNSSFLVDRFNHGAAYWIYGVVACLALYFLRFVPETKQKTLEEIESYWRKKSKEK